AGRVSWSARTRAGTGPGVASAALFRRGSQASYWRRSSSRRWITAVLFEDPLGIPLPSCGGSLRLEARHGVAAQLDRPAERPRGEDDARGVLKALHPDPGRVERRPDRHRAVIGKQQGIVPGDDGLDP